MERVGALAAVLAFAAGNRTAALLTAGALVAVFSVHGLLRSALARHARAALSRGAVDALLSSNLMLTSSNDDLLVAAVEGQYLGQQLLAEQLPALAGDAAAAPVIAAVLALEAPPRALLVGVVASVLAALAVIAVRAATSRQVQAALSAFDPVYEDITMAACATLEVVGNGRAGELRALLSEHLAKWLPVAARTERFSALAGRAPIVLATGAVVVALAFDASLRGAVAGSVLLSAAVGACAAPVLLGLTKGALDALRTAGRMRPLFDLLEAEEAPRGAPTGTPLPTLPAPIEWLGVSFTYDVQGRAGEAFSLRDVTVAWAPGQVLALQGPNGSGKSTLIRLLLGLARPQSGRIRVGGVDLFELDLDAWRGAIAYLPQRPYFSDRASVRDAIGMLARGADEGRMRDALASVGLWTSLAAQSDHPLSTPVGNLSAGQRQRLALARTLCQDAPIVLLDEPDVNLDADGVAVVARIVQELRRDRMVAIVAHTNVLLRLGDVSVTMADGARMELTALAAGG